MQYENTFIVFDVTKGPKVIIEALNTYGEEGWECATMITVGNANIVAFLKRAVGQEEVKADPVTEKINKLWAADTTDKK